MWLEDFIKKSLMELSESTILGQIDFDIAVVPFDGSIYVLRDADPNASHIRFTVNIGPKLVDGRRTFDDYDGRDL